MSEQEFEYKPVTAAPSEPDYVKKLTNEQALVVEARLANESKSTAVAYILWFFLGGLAIHCFYLGKNKIGIVRLVLSLIAWFQFLYGFGAALNNDDGSSMGIGLLLFIILGIWWIIDLFMIPSTIKKTREARRQEIAKEIISINGSKE